MNDLKQQVEVAENGVVFVTTLKTIKNEDGSGVIEHNRTGYHPNADVTELPQEIQDVCLEAWTSDVVEAFKMKLNAPLL